MNTDDLLNKQLELTQKIIERMDTMIDVMKNDLNIETDTGNTDDVVEFYTPSGKKEWVGIPENIDDLINIGINPGLKTRKFHDIWGDGHSYPESNDDLDQMDSCLVRNVAKAQRKTILKMEIEMEALRGIIADMREQINRQAIRELEREANHE